MIISVSKTVVYKNDDLHGNAICFAMHFKNETY